MTDLVHAAESWFLIEKLIIPQLAKIFPQICRTRRFVNTFTNDHPLPLTSDELRPRNPIRYFTWPSALAEFFQAASFLDAFQRKSLCVLLTVHPRAIYFKWSQLGARYFLVYLFQLLYMCRAGMCPSSGELTVSMRHWYIFTLCGWLTGLLVGMSLNPTSRPVSHPHRVKIYQCRIDTISSSSDGHIVARNMYRSWNKYTKK